MSKYYNDEDYDREDRYRTNKTTSNKMMTRTQYLNEWMMQYYDDIENIWHNLKNYTDNMCLPLLNECNFGNFSNFAINHSSDSFSTENRK